MPRALISDVRSLANADSLIFPFLAPRAFAVPPFRPTAPRRNARTYSNLQKKKERGNVAQNVETLYSSKKDESHERGDACSNTPSNIRANGRKTSSLRYTQAVRNQYPSLRPSTSTLWHTDCRYSDIYYYGRAQCATYSTKTSTTPSHSNDPTLGDTTGPCTQISGQSEVEQPPRKSHPVPNLEPLWKGGRRRKALESARNRLQNFVSLLPFWQTKVMRHGRYRSLSRRIYALCRSKPTDILLKKDSISGENVLIRAFAALDQKVHELLQKMCYPITLKHDPQTHEMASKISEAVVDDKPGASIDRKRMMLNWMTFSKQERDTEWHFVLLYLIDKRPALALAFVQVLAQESTTTALRLEALADTIEHIARSSIYRKRMGLDDDNKDLIVPIFSQIFSNHLARYPMICSQDLLWSVARLSSPNDLKHIFDLLVEHKAYIGYDTLLHFANLFGEFGNHEYALRCMRQVVDSIPSPVAAQDLIRRKRFLWSCALILRRSTNKGQNYHATTEIVADFLKLGVKLDILLYNIIMHNAMEAGDHTTAFRVFSVLEENGLNPNHYTYGILLHGCTISDDPGRFNVFAEHCKRKAIELKNSWLAAEYMYYVYVLHHEDDPAHLSDHLRQSYAQFFSTASVAPFYPSESRTSLDQGMPEGQQEVEAGKMEPPPLAVYLILQTEIRKALAISNTHVWDLYLHFCRLVDEDSYPAVNMLAQSPIIWNAFLLAFCMGQQFANASHLIKSMTDSPDSRVPQPNVYSWNIFMQAFFKNEQIRAAERIYEIMRARGVDSDQFTYGVMLRGYARAQHSEKVGEIMGHMENEEQLDPSVLQVLTRVHDRKRLMFALEQSRLVKENAEKQKVAALEEEERKRWELPKLSSKPSSERLPAHEKKELSGESPHMAALLEPTENLEGDL